MAESALAARQQLLALPRARHAVPSGMTIEAVHRRCPGTAVEVLIPDEPARPLDVEEPARAADAVAAMCLEHAVLTAVARDETLRSLPGKPSNGWTAH